MAANATVVVTGSFVGLPAGSRVIGPVQVSTTAASGQVVETVLQAGANTITVPTLPAPTGCLIQLPATNTSITTLKGVAGDTGIAIGKTGFLLLNWDSTAPPASFVLSSVATQTALTTEVTFY